jgi:hypothetical protein
MARHYNQARYVLPNPFTNTIVFVMSGSMMDVNRFRLNIKNVHQRNRYNTEYFELLKQVMGEGNSTNDGSIPYKHGIIVAIARKT